MEGLAIKQLALTFLFMISHLSHFQAQWDSYLRAHETGFKKCNSVQPPETTVFMF